MSPEIAKGVQYSKEADVWAYGCFAYELVDGETPHHHHINYHGYGPLLKTIVSVDAPPI